MTPQGAFLVQRTIQKTPQRTLHGIVWIKYAAAVWQKRSRVCAEKGRFGPDRSLAGMASCRSCFRHCTALFRPFLPVGEVALLCLCTCRSKHSLVFFSSLLPRVSVSLYRLSNVENIFCVKLVPVFSCLALCGKFCECVDQGSGFRRNVYMPYVCIGCFRSNAHA